MTYDFRHRSAAVLPRKGRKYNFAFNGDNQGDWQIGGYLDHNDWTAAASLSSKNEWRNLSVEGATEYHTGFRKALKEIVREYPELQDFWVSFDGPYIPVEKLLGIQTKAVNWSNMKFLHGTSGKAADIIIREGLRPRSETNVNPAYGATNVGAGNPKAIYLTTQESMARFAAMDASRGTGTEPTILEVRGLDSDSVAADEDSKETDPVRSLEKLGSVAYLKSIPRQNIRVVSRMFDRRWVVVA